MVRFWPAPITAEPKLWLNWGTGTTSSSVAAAGEVKGAAFRSPVMVELAMVY